MRVVGGRLRGRNLASPASQDATVMLLTNGGFACTATLVAPNLVITARHCVASDLDETNPCGPVRADLPAQPRKSKRHTVSSRFGLRVPFSCWARTAAKRSSYSREWPK